MDIESEAPSGLVLTQAPAPQPTAAATPVEKPTIANDAPSESDLALVGGNPLNMDRVVNLTVFERLLDYNTQELARIQSNINQRAMNCVPIAPNPRTDEGSGEQAELCPEAGVVCFDQNPPANLVTAEGYRLEPHSERDQKIGQAIALITSIYQANAELAGLSVRCAANGTIRNSNGSQNQPVAPTPYGESPGPQGAGSY